jgi:signal transduction histidine kinase
LKQSDNQIINDIVVDKQNHIWLGTDLGLIMYRNVVFNNPFAHLTQRYIQDIRKGIERTLYFTDGTTVYCVDEKFNATPYFTLNKGLIITIQPDDSGIWMGTNDGKLLFKDFNGALQTTDFSKFGQGIYNLTIDKEANKWIIQSQPDKETLLRIDSKGEVTDFTPEMEKGDRVRALKLSPLGELFVGASGDKNYLFSYNYQKQILENLSVPISKEFDGQIAVNDIAFTDSGSLLLATKFGVWSYFKKFNTQINLGTMTNEMVSAIAIDNSNIVWLANSNGILKYKKGRVTVFDNTDGLPAKTTNYRCLTLDANNNLWIGTISGLAVGKMNFNEQITPKPVMVSLEKSGIQINFSNANRIVEKNHLAFNFATPVYPAKYIRYQYSLSKNNEATDWIELGGYNDYLFLDNLQHGDYRLQVRAKIKGNFSWSEPFSYNFTIFKIWYTRPIVLISIYLLVFFFIYIYTKLHQRKNEKEKKKLEDIIRNRTQSLSDQNEELKMLNANLQVAKEESEAAIKTKDRFFSILAHDLKSPFNTLIGFSQLLVHNRNEISEESMQELFREMLKISENTYNLLQNLLEWAMSQTGALRIEKKHMLLIDLLNEVLPTLEAFAKQKEIEIKLEVHNSLIVYADEALIGTVFRNLISNAIKFSHNNTTIRILGIEKNGITEISVIDSGIGIEKEKLDKLFVIDENVSTPGTDNEIGTGLGLVLCNEFINKSTGTISVKSEVGVGTTFIIQLPLN